MIGRLRRPLRQAQDERQTGELTDPECHMNGKRLETSSDSYQPPNTTETEGT
ncbi:hypothetical protein PTT_18682 [Pyrenophora teres f. teres 0-1]|uniref:Uncharacterized protein n=1 Tax=Pyrenophora teres f. teres (strain 0-1) TaxID=861557 RepID=E3S7A2_PYRTT|nr:hypothetical protein PTT_18682 [Pyrenophora teres f. teres 0-1]